MLSKKTMRTLGSVLLLALLRSRSAASKPLGKPGEEGRPPGIVERGAGRRIVEERPEGRLEEDGVGRGEPAPAPELPFVEGPRPPDRRVLMPLFHRLSQHLVAGRPLLLGEGSEPLLG